MAADVMRAPGAGAGVPEYVKPNEWLTAAERLDIYRRQYWLRMLAALEEDFPGLRLVVGVRAFRKLAAAYVEACPSRSFTLRDFGRGLPEWLRGNPGHSGA